jgi:hypothetical protein
MMRCCSNVARALDGIPKLGSRFDDVEGLTAAKATGLEPLNEREFGLK